MTRSQRSNTHHQVAYSVSSSAPAADSGSSTKTPTGVIIEKSLAKGEVAKVDPADNPDAQVAVLAGTAFVTKVANVLEEPKQSISRRNIAREECQWLAFGLVHTFVLVYISDDLDVKRTVWEETTATEEEN